MIHIFFRHDYIFLYFSILLVNPLNTTRYWKILETWFLHILSCFGSKIFLRWSHVHNICRSRDNFSVTSNPVEDNGNNIVFWIIDLLLTKQKWWQILSLTWYRVLFQRRKSIFGSPVTIWYSKDIIWNEEIREVCFTMS